MLKQNKTLLIPFVVTLIGVLIMVVGIFLPYMTASGAMAEYIEAFPDKVEIAELDLTASDLKNIPVLSVSQIITGVYGEDDGAIANVIVLVFGAFLALTALFVILQKPIPVLIFNLLSFAVFAFLNFLMNGDFIDPDKYAWGIGYYIILIAALVTLVGAIWFLVAKKAVKNAKEINEIVNTDTTVEKQSEEV